MLAKVLKLYEIDETCCILNAKLIIKSSEMVKRILLIHITMKEQSHLNKGKVKTK